ncbi:MAG: tyrosine-type recombinase/integrase [Anaerolineae bacterium]|nr:tyrosine-type recombinase/integrase [Anaerolineae bacterium]
MDRTTLQGERDYVLLALLYDTGARIQELLDLTPSDIRLASPAVARLHGKGRRERLCPLLPQTARLVNRYLARVGRPLDDRSPLFRNRYGQPLKRHGARYLLIKYLDRARASMPVSVDRGSVPTPSGIRKPCTCCRPAFPLYDQRLPRACRCDIHRSVRADRSRHEARGARPCWIPGDHAEGAAPLERSHGLVEAL